MASEKRAIPAPGAARDTASDVDAGNHNSQNGDNTSLDNLVRHGEPEAEATRFQKVKAHFSRFRWWYLLGLVIFLAILLPLLFTVIIPAIVQNVLKSQKLPIYSGSLQALSPTNLNMSIDTMIDCPIPAKLDEMDLVLYNKNTTPQTPFLSLLFPSMKVKGKTDAGIKDQTLPVLNDTELTTWFNEFFDQPKVKLSLKSQPTVHLGALKYSKSLDKTIEVPSLNYLNGFGVTNQEFNFNKNETKYNMKGTLNIPNAGVLSLGLGDLQFNVMSGDLSLGLINIYNLTLQPGNNSVPFEGNFYFNELVPNLHAVLDSQKNALSHGYLEFFASGNTSMIDGQHIPYLEGVLNKKRIRFTLSVITLLADVVAGIMGADQGDLLDIFGDTIGNTTLLEQILDHWNETNQQRNGTENGLGLGNGRKRGVVKRAMGGKMWMLHLLRLGTKARKARI